MPIKTYRINLTALTPVFIGGGSESSLNRSQYIYDIENKLVHILDETEFIKFLHTRELFDEYIKYVQKASRASQNPNANELHLSHWLAKEGVEDFSVLAARSAKLETPDKIPSDLNDIKSFIRNGLNQPYIPGSSLKGALRSTIISYHIKKKNSKDSEWDKIEKKLLDSKPAPDSKALKEQIKNYRIEEHYLRLNSKEKYNSLNDAFRFFSVSDTFPLKNDDLFISRSLRLSTYRKHGSYLKKLPLYMEYLRPGTKAVFYLTLDIDRLAATDLGQIGKMKEILIWQEERIPELLNEEVFNKIARDEGIDYCYSFAPKIKPNFILGGQAGFQTKTLVPVLAKNNLALTRVLLNAYFPKHQHLNLDKKASPRTLKLAYHGGKYYITGLCRLDIDEEVKI